MLSTSIWNKNFTNKVFKMFQKTRWWNLREKIIMGYSITVLKIWNCSKTRS